MKRIFLAVLFLFTSFIYCQSKDNADCYFKFQYDTIVEKTFVLDFEKLFDKTETKELNKLISDFEIASSIEIAIITFDEKYESDEDFHKSALFAANWIGIGKKELNNGILIGISNKSRKIRIENGIGIETVLTDAETKSIIDNSFIPYFKEKNFYKGTVEGIKKIIEILKVKLGQEITK